MTTSCNLGRQPRVAGAYGFNHNHTRILPADNANGGEKMDNLILEGDVREWVRRLPDLTVNPPMTHLLMLAIRSRKAKEQLGQKMKDLVIERDIIRAMPGWRDRYFNAVCNMAVLKEYGRYEFRDITVTPGVTGIFGTVAPRDVMNAVSELVKENVTLAFQHNDEAMYELAKQTSKYFGLLHKHKTGGFHVSTVDVDDASIYPQVRDEVSVLPRYMTTKTSRGYHIILNLSRGEDAMAFYRSDKEHPGILSKLKLHLKVDIQRDAQEPIPGTRYASVEDINNYVRIIE